jgi:hypothetical protein
MLHFDHHFHKLSEVCGAVLKPFEARTGQPLTYVGKGVMKAQIVQRVSQPQLDTLLFQSNTTNTPYYLVCCLVAPNDTAPTQRAARVFEMRPPQRPR